MYKDYYSVLKVPYYALQEDIKRRYRELAKKWHPDVNKSEEAKPKMQEIVEAYLVLGDPEARRRYDIVHKCLFRRTEPSNKQNQKKTNSEASDAFSFAENENESKSSTVTVDPILDNWIDKAREQAKEFIIQAIKDTKGITANGCRYTLYAIGVTILLFIALMIIATIIGQSR